MFSSFPLLPLHPHSHLLPSPLLPPLIPSLLFTIKVTVKVWFRRKIKFQSNFGNRTSRRRRSGWKTEAGTEEEGPRGVREGKSGGGAGGRERGEGKSGGGRLEQRT